MKVEIIKDEFDAFQWKSDNIQEAYDVLLQQEGDTELFLYSDESSCFGIRNDMYDLELNKWYVFHSENVEILDEEEFKSKYIIK